MFFNFLRNGLTFILALVIAGIINVTTGYLYIGCIVGGLLIGLLIKKHELLYGAFAGIFYVVLALAIAIAVGLDSSINDTLSLLFSTFRARDILRLFLIIILFIVSAWFGVIIKRQIFSAQLKNHNN